MNAIREPRAWPLALLGLMGTIALTGLLAHPAIVRAAGAPAALRPLPASDYSVRAVCPARPAGRARCAALELVPRTAAASAHTHPIGIALAASPSAGEGCHPPLAEEGCWGLRPQDLHAAYALPTSTEAAATQTIAIVDAFGDPNAAKDLKIYDDIFKLPACTSSNGCFKQVNQDGKHKPLPETNGEWALETSLDIESAHAVCQQCHILLVEANSDEFKDLEAAEMTAVAAGATEISDSWYELEPEADSAAFDQPGVVITAAAGDFGYLNWQEPEEAGVYYPASSPHVVAVGGTRLSLESPSSTWKSETLWNGYGAGGSGCSKFFAAPPWQQSLSDWDLVGCGANRAVADVSADADPYTGFAVYDTTPLVTGEQAPGWQTVGGTSLSSPVIAATFALAGGAAGVAYPARTLYEGERRDPEALHDVQTGSNGACSKRVSEEGVLECSTREEGESCEQQLICVAGSGYDGPSGVGTPDGLTDFQPGRAQTITFTSRPPSSAVVAGSAYAVAATASSNLPVSFTSATPAVCTLEGATASFIGAGACTIEADQSGNAQFAPAPQVQQSFTVGKGQQRISFTSTAPTGAVVGGAAYAVTATASPSGLPVSLSSATPSVCTLEGSAASFGAAGTCTIDANQPGSANYEAAPEEEQSFTVAPAEQQSGTSNNNENLGGGGGGGGGGGSSSTLSFTSSLVSPDSAFTVLASPVVKRHTGAVTFEVSVLQAGTLSWLVTFANGPFGAFAAARGDRCRPGHVKLAGRCRPARVLFASGKLAVGAAGAASFTATPSASARTALADARKSKRSLTLTVTLTYRSALGGSSVSHALTLGDRTGR